MNKNDISYHENEESRRVKVLSTYIMPSRSIMTLFTVQTDRSNDLMKTPRRHLINENSDWTISSDFSGGGKETKNFTKKSNFNERKIKYLQQRNFQFFFTTSLNIQSIKLSASQTFKINFITFSCNLYDFQIIFENLRNLSNFQIENYLKLPFKLFINTLWKLQILQFFFSTSQIS